jgi:hypothetical protein
MNTHPHGSGVRLFFAERRSPAGGERGDRTLTIDTYDWEDGEEIRSEETETDGYHGLANAIVLQAVEDYRMADDEWERKKIERFFRSDWFAMLTKADPEFLITKLRKEKKHDDR